MQKEPAIGGLDKRRADKKGGKKKTRRFVRIAYWLDCNFYADIIHIRISDLLPATNAAIAAEKDKTI
jgi:hypothetical protein